MRFGEVCECSCLAKSGFVLPCRNRHWGSITRYVGLRSSNMPFGGEMIIGVGPS